MFEEAEIAEHLLKNKQKISHAASLQQLDKLWKQFPVNSPKIAKTKEQLKNCTKPNSLWICRQTPHLSDYYKIGKVLGSPGQYGICKEVLRKKDGKLFAVKIINKRKYNKDKQLTSNFFNELRAETYLLAKANDHPNIISYHEIFEDIHHFYIVMDHCGGGELFDRISREQKFSEKMAGNLFRQMMSALYYIHSLGIAHCDLKPENFLFETSDDNSRILLIDFGMAKVVEWRKYYKAINGTPYYIAPEVLHGKYNEVCDMWSMGVILFIMIFGFPPFHCSKQSISQSQSDGIIFKKIKKGFTPKVLANYGSWFPDTIPVSSKCRDLIARLLRKNVADRLTAEEALEHQWLQQSITIEGKEEVNLYKEQLQLQPIKRVINSPILNSLRGFTNSKTGLQTQILGLLQKCNYLNTNQTKSVREFFDAADKDGDGRVSAQELFSALKQVDKDITMADVQSILTSIDDDNNGYIDYDELLSSRINRKLQSNEDRLRKVFELLDFDKSGKISKQELQSALESIDNKKLTDKQCDELIKECDKDGDGEIDFEEFIQLFRAAKL